ncbi:hypothetical protein [Helicobacter sp. T3_23-1059]
MKHIVMLYALLVCISPLFAGDYGAKELIAKNTMAQIHRLKYFGLTYCLGIYDNPPQSKAEENAREMYIDVDDEIRRDKIIKYIDNLDSDAKRITTEKRECPSCTLRRCISIYHSAQYHIEAEKIITERCKECKYRKRQQDYGGEPLEFWELQSFKENN